MGETITILGPGLLGASLAKAVKLKGIFERVKTWSRRKETREKCIGQDWCDEVLETAEEAVAGADFVVLCPPVQVIPGLLEQLADHFEKGAIVTDVGSTKATICEAAQKVLPREVEFLGSHPMAGSEKTGLEHAQADLFEGMACILTPTESNTLETISKVDAFWQALGMRTGQTSPEEHDKIVAAVSHLPHVLASVLSENLLRKPGDWKNYAGKGLRDTTRIAAGDPLLWRQIIEENAGPIEEMLNDFKASLNDFQDALKQRDFDRIEKILEDGKVHRDSLPLIH
jgi:cyclohexadieny/prephenate dehydrogenase